MCSLGSLRFVSDFPELDALDSYCSISICPETITFELPQRDHDPNNMSVLFSFTLLQNVFLEGTRCNNSVSSFCM